MPISLSLEVGASSFAHRNSYSAPNWVWVPKDLGAQEKLSPVGEGLDGFQDVTGAVDPSQLARPSKT